MHRSPCCLSVTLLFIITLGLSDALLAAPITFNTALPVAQGAFLNREQFIVRRFYDDTALDRDLEVNGLVSVLGYGVNSKLALFAALPYVDKSLGLGLDGQRFSRSSQGIGDLRSFARYTFLQRDARSKTLRIAGFAGLKAPTGDDSQLDARGRLPIPLQSGTGAWDSFAGAVFTYQTLGFQFDAQLSFENNGTANGFSAGNEAKADVSYQYRLLPRKLGNSSHHFVYAVLEANLAYQAMDRISGTDDPNSGGSSLYLTPGIQYVTAKYILEAAVQLPVKQNLHGTALETDYVFTTGFRINL